MALFQYDVTVEIGGGTLLDNVQTIQITRGRVQIQDPFKAGTAIITGRVPSSLPAGLVIGTEINIQESTGSVYMFVGTVADVSISYGNIPEMDVWTIRCEDVLAAAGRAYLPGTGSSPSTNVYDVANIVANQTSIGVIDVWGIESDSIASSVTYNNQDLLQVLQELIFTDQGRIFPINSYGTIGWASRAALGQWPEVCLFTDESATLAGYDKVYYQAIDFSSMADSYFDRVLVEPVGLATQSAGATDGRTFTGVSRDATTTQAQNLADYVLQTLQVNTSVPFSVSIVSENQPNQGIGALDAYYYAGQGARAKLILRGTTYNVFIEGATLTANPDQTRITYNLVSSEAMNFFILDDPTFGVLDSSKLGF